MNEISEILIKIMRVSEEYRLKLDELKEDFESQCFSNLESLDFEKQIKGQTYALMLLKEYTASQIESAINFIEKWTMEGKIKYLINFDCHSLTNGKFYDFAIGHEMWQLKRPDIYNLIENKKNEYLELERNLKLAFRKYVALNYKKTIWYFPSKLLVIINNELDKGNQIVEASSDEYFQNKIFIKFKYRFQKDYRKELNDTNYRNLNDIKYWNEEYQDYHFIIASGFEQRKRTFFTWISNKFDF